VCGIISDIHMEKNFLKIVVCAAIFLVPFFAHAADLSVSPNSGSYTVGDRVTLKIVVSGNTPINAVSSNISIPKNIFTIDSVTKDDSVLNFWVTEPSFSNTNGTVSFEGVSLGGYIGNSGNIVTLRLRAIGEGSGTITINSAQILANDGQGTNVTGALRNGTYTIQKAVVKEVIPEKKPEPKIETKQEPAPQPVEEVIEKPQKAPGLNAPEIVSVKKFGEHAVAGSSQYPRSQALITFIDNSGYKVFITSTTDDKGEFYTLVPKSLKYGVYKVTAVVITSDLSNSLKSNELEITIGNLFSDIGIVPVLIVVSLFAIMSGILLRKTSHIRKERKEAKDILKKSFKVLEDDIKNNSIKDLKDDLKDAERVIEKEIKDIGSL